MIPKNITKFNISLNDFYRTLWPYLILDINFIYYMYSIQNFYRYSTLYSILKNKYQTFCHSPWENSPPRWSNLFKSNINSQTKTKNLLSAVNLNEREICSNWENKKLDLQFFAVWVRSKISPKKRTEEEFANVLKFQRCYRLLIDKKDKKIAANNDFLSMSSMPPR